MQLQRNHWTNAAAHKFRPSVFLFECKQPECGFGCSQSWKLISHNVAYHSNFMS
jgi:hypothetical protein